MPTATATLICNSAIMRQAIVQSLTSQNIEVVRICGSCDLGCLNDPKSDIAIAVTGFCMEGERPRCLARQNDVSPSDRWVFMSNSRSDEAAASKSRSGASVCIVPDDISGSELSHVAALVLEGSTISIGRFASGCTQTDIDRISAARLDAGQMRLLSHLSDGLSNKSIARIEDCTEATIKARIRMLLQRLNLDNRTQAAVLAARVGTFAPKEIQYPYAEGSAPQT